MKRTTHPPSDLIQATQRICSLPAIPTQDWATDVAKAISTLSPSAIVGVLIANLDPVTNALDPISTGVHRSTPTNGENTSESHTQDPDNQSLYLQDKLERVTSLDFQIPDDAHTRGLVVPFSILHPSWTTTQIGRIFAAQHLQSPILAMVPITHKHPGFVVIITLAFEADHDHRPTEHPISIEYMTETLSCLIPILSHKAKAALEQVTNPKAWLTDREHEILEQLILGHSVRVIAINLGRSAHTVHDHVKNLHKKLGASSRGELIAKALGYTSSPQSEQTPAPDPIVLTGSSQLAELKPQPHTAAQAKALRHSARETRS